jgi:hypothetical protein
MSTIHAKLVAIQSDLKAPKNQTNAFGKYKYRSCEDILEAAKPLLKEHGLVLTLSDDIVEVGGRVYVRASASVTDGENHVQTTAFARESLDKKGMDDAQITGSASSYARKYALNGLFCIDDTKDSDATNDHGKAPQKPITVPQSKYVTIPKPVEEPKKPDTTTVMEYMNDAKNLAGLAEIVERIKKYKWTKEEMDSIMTCHANVTAKLS